MMTHWRVVKMSTNKTFSYVALEFDMLTGQVTTEQIKSNNTNVRKRKTTEFEIREVNGKGIAEWMTVPYKEVLDLMRDFNKVRYELGLRDIIQSDILKMLYELEDLR
jgi:hypothetical protein